MRGPGRDLPTASAMRLRSTVGSSSAITAWITEIGSRSSRSGHCAHRGCPARSRSRPSAAWSAAGARCRSWLAGPAIPVLTSAVRVRSGLPHSAQTGGETAVAPAARSAMQQVADRPGRRGAAVEQHARTFRQETPPAAVISPAHPRRATTTDLDPLECQSVRPPRPGP